MAQLGSVSGIAENVLIVSGKKNECNIASARSNCFCASGEHEVLKSTRPSCSGFLRVAGSASAHTDATRYSAEISATRMLKAMLMTVLPTCSGRWGDAADA